MRISEAGGQTVATDIVTMFKSVDRALLDTAQLTHSVLETNAGSDIPPCKLQKALDAAASGFAKLVDGRKDMINMQRGLVSLKNGSNLETTDFGCWRLFMENATPEVTAAA